MPTNRGNAPNNRITVKMMPITAATPHTNRNEVAS